MYEELSDATHSREAWKSAAEATKTNLDDWRAKYELSQLTPEIKADTEAAFKRGAQFAKQQMINAICDLATNLKVDAPLEDADAKL